MSDYWLNVFSKFITYYALVLSEICNEYTELTVAYKQQQQQQRSWIIVEKCAQMSTISNSSHIMY